MEILSAKENPFSQRISRKKISPEICLEYNNSGQIIATENTTDLPPKWWWIVREMGPLISGKSRLVKYYNLASNNVILYHSLSLNNGFLEFEAIEKGIWSHTLLEEEIQLNFLFVRHWLHGLEDTCPRTR